MKNIEEAINKANELFALSSLQNWREPLAYAVEQVLRLNPDNLSVQLVAPAGIYILAQIEDRHLHIDLIFDEETGIFEEAVVNVFLNRTQQLCVFGTLEDVSLEIENYFQHTS